MGAPKGSKNALGNKGGRQYPQRTIADFWKELDNVSLPLANRLCQDTINMVQDEHSNEREWRALGIQAAKVLFSKAPERHADNEGGKLATPIIYLPKQDE